MTQISLSNTTCPTPKANRFSVWRLFSLARQRRALANLDDRALEDIGITREAALTEAARPIWDAPETWHKNLY